MNLTMLKRNAFQMQAAIQGIIDDLSLLEGETSVQQGKEYQKSILSSLSDITSKARSIREDIQPPSPPASLSERYYGKGNSVVDFHQ